MGVHHGKTTTDGNHSNANRGAQEAGWQVDGRPVGSRPAAGPGSAGHRHPR